MPLHKNWKRGQHLALGARCRKFSPSSRYAIAYQRLRSTLITCRYCLLLVLRAYVAMCFRLVEPLDMKRVLTGEQSPMFFGSAMTNFGVELFLKRFLTIGQKPASRPMGVSGICPSRVVLCHLYVVYGVFYTLTDNCAPCELRSRRCFLYSATHHCAVVENLDIKIAEHTM